VSSGLLAHVEEVETFCEEIPKTKVILDHFGFCKDVDGAWAKLIEWSKYEQVSLMDSLVTIWISSCRFTSRQVPSSETSTNDPPISPSDHVLERLSTPTGLRE